MPAIDLTLGHAPVPRRPHGDDESSAPFRIVVLGDFSGLPRERRPALAGRRPVRVDIDNVESVFARVAPHAEIAGLQDETGMPLRIRLETIDDFAPDALLARLPAGARPTASVPASADADAPPAPAGAHAGLGETNPPAPADEDAAAMMTRLLGGSLPAVAAAPAPAFDDAVDRFVRQLAGRPAAAAPEPAPGAALPGGSSDGAAALLRQVLRDPAWRRLEGAWRAVDRFVRELDMADGDVRLELFDCRADELLADLRAVGGDPARGALAPVLQGDGRGCDIVVSLEKFGPGLVELSLLAGLAAAAAAQGAVLLAGAAAPLAAVAASQDEAVRASDEARVWRALRGSGLASRIGLTFPRVLARLPYGPRQEPVAAFPFDELADASPATLHERLAWRSAALDAALLLAQGHVDGGVETRVRLEGLPAFVDRSGDEPALQPVAEAWIGEREAGELQAAGLIALQSDRRRPEARVACWQSIAAGGVPLAGSWR